MGAERWGRSMGRHRRAVIAVWALLVLASLAATPYLEKQLGAPDYGVPGSQSAQVNTLLQRHFSGLGSEQDLVVFTAESGSLTDPAGRAAVVQVLDAARRAPHVAAVVGPFDPQARRQVSADGTAAFALLGLNGTSKELGTRAQDVQDAVRAAAGPAHVHAWLTGYSPITNDLTVVENADSERAESIGIPVALIVLLLALGAVVAALLPLLLAMAGLCLTFGAITVLTLAIHADAFLVAIVTMIGLGIGIDYALFIVSRFREELTRRAGTGPGTPAADRRERAEAAGEAAGVALATSGRTVLFSGAILAVSMCSLLIVNSPVFQEIGIGVLLVVVCTVVAAWTLLPAVLTALGPRVNAWSLPRRFQPAEVRTDATPGSGGWARWAHAVMRRPIVSCVAVVAVLVVCALPVGSLHYGIDLGTSSLAGQPSAAAQQVLLDSFGPGLVSPVQVVVTGAGDAALDGEGRQRAQQLGQALARDPRVASVDTIGGDGRVLLDAVPSVPVDSTAAQDLVTHIRSDLAPAVSPDGRIDVLVGGASAQFADVSGETSRKIPYILLIVLGLTVAFLVAVFRSVALPVKAIVMNLLATAASVGATVAVFQWGWGSSLLGFTSVGFLQVYIPITVFVMLFGLSMDYEVFLIRRIQEVWRETGDNSEAVATGVQHTARPIAAAAAIMIAVFGSFVTAGVLELKQFGLALALAVLLDASLVRLVLVPAFMRLLGRWNWWLPGSDYNTPVAVSRPGRTEVPGEPVRTVDRSPDPVAPEPRTADRTAGRR